MAEAVLEMHVLTKRFGALAAVDGVSLCVERGSIHAVIGPNGAGKSTLLNLLAGELPATEGRILFRSQDITRATADRRSRMGIGRSYQSPARSASGSRCSRAGRRRCASSGRRETSSA
jgi:branched-chain amino acid transport system ATP-binding protein